jgi:hypothetical protein
MYDDMYIPWTPWVGFRKKNQPVAEEPAEAASPEVCHRTLDIVKAIIAHALEPLSDATRAISAAFLAYHRGELDIDALLAKSAFTRPESVP